MHVVYLHQYFNTPDMSGGTRSYEMARRLVAAGHQVDLITTWREAPAGRRNWFQSDEQGIRVHWQCVPYSNKMGFRERVSAFLKFAFGAARYATSVPADVVFATSTPLTIAIPGIFAAWRLKVPLVFEVRDLWPEVPIALGVLNNPLLKALARLLEKVTYRYSTRIVALAPGMKEAIVSQGINPEKIDVIPNGADLDLFSASQPVSPEQLRHQNDIPVEGRVVLYAGTIGSVNNVDFIVRMAAFLQKRDGDEPLIFVIIGAGIEQATLEQEAKSYGVLNRSVFFLGARPKREVSAWYQACTASLMTYNGPEVVFRDSVSNKFFDSLAAGKPVFANFHGFSTITAEEASAGAIISNDPERAAGELVERLSDEVWMRSAAENALKLGRTKFSRDMLAERLSASLTRAYHER